MGTEKATGLFKEEQIAGLPEMAVRLFSLSYLMESGYEKAEVVFVGLDNGACVLLGAWCCGILNL
jgi:hypothetical protein